MITFPGVDPIPLPAPILFFKILHTLMLTLHFYAVYILLGGMIIAGLAALRSKLTPNMYLSEYSGQIIKRLPTVVAFVINFAIPPLLFTQVLYGRALFPSTVAIGVWWLSVIFLVLITYYLLYISQKRMETGKAWWWISLIAYVLGIKVAFIYSNTMTLMLRPEVWNEMYGKNPSGFQLPTGDPTILPRWIYMLTASIAIGAAAWMILSLRKTLKPEISSKIIRLSAVILSIFSILQAAAGYAVFNSQPEIIQNALKTDPVTSWCIWSWGISLVVLLLTGILLIFKNKVRKLLVNLLLLTAGFLNVLSWVIIRDGIRDFTLKIKDFDIWDRQIAVEWSVVIFFLALFALAVFMTGWMTIQLFKIGKERVQDEKRKS